MNKEKERDIPCAMDVALSVRTRIPNNLDSCTLSPPWFEFPKPAQKFKFHEIIIQDFFRSS
jgi:hypothetical protein